MTEQQEPERIWITGTSKCGAWNVKPNPNRYLHEHEKAYVPHDLLEAAEKRGDALLAENITVHERAKKADAERDQALASVGAVIEKAMDAANEADSLELALHGSVRIVMRIHAINPDATAALNEMLADAWVEGMWVGLGEDSPPINDNPYRTQPSRSSDAEKSEDRG